MTAAASCISLISSGNLSLSAAPPHGDGGRQQVGKISVSATASHSLLREARNLRMFRGTISMTAKTVMHAFDTDRGFGLNADPAYKSRKSNFSFNHDDSFSFDNDKSFNKSYGSGFENSQSPNQNQGYGFNQRTSTESQGKKLFVGNLPWSAEEQSLEGIFQEAGTVELVEVVYDKVTGRSRGFAFVTMGSADEAEAAVSKLDGYSLGGRSIKVNISSGKGGGSARSSGGFPSGNFNAFGSSEIGDSSKVFVGNLPWGVDDAALENMFNSYGEVVEARVVYDRNSGQSRGFGFVTLSSPGQASEAVSSLNGSDFDGRPLRVNLAGERPAPRF